MTQTSTTPKLHPAAAGDESTIDTASMLAAIAAQQLRIVATLSGLDDQMMLRSALPSGWTFAGMVEHPTRMTTGDSPGRRDSTITPG